MQIELAVRSNRDNLAGLPKRASKTGQHTQAIRQDSPLYPTIGLIAYSLGPDHPGAQPSALYRTRREVAFSYSVQFKKPHKDCGFSWTILRICGGVGNEISVAPWDFCSQFGRLGFSIMIEPAFPDGAHACCDIFRRVLFILIINVVRFWKD